MDSSSNHFVGQEANEGLFVEGIPKERFLGHRPVYLFGQRRCLLDVDQAATLAQVSVSKKNAIFMASESSKVALGKSRRMGASYHAWKPSR